MAIERIIIDFDHTLFDTDALKRDLSRAIGEFGVKSDLFWETYPKALQFVSGEMGYNTDKHLDILQKFVSFDAATARSKMDKVIGNSKNYLFPDTLNFLSRMVGLNVPLVMLSRGDRAFQNAKIRAAGIERYFREIHLTSEKKVSILPQLIKGDAKHIFFINDHLEETREVMQAFKEIKPVLLRRKDFSPEDYVHVGMLNFETLSEIKDYLTVYHASTYAGQ